MFLLFYFLNNSKGYEMFYIECPEINLENSYLIKFNDKTILNIGDFEYDNKIIANYKIFTKENNNEIEILFNNYENLTIIEDKNKHRYFKEETFKNLSDIFITVYFRDKDNYNNKTFKLNFIKANIKSKNGNSIKKADTKVLLENNGYSLLREDYYFKRKENLELYYDLKREIFYANIHDKQMTYETKLIERTNNINMKGYYNGTIKFRFRS